MDTVSYLLGKKTGGTPTVLQDKEVNITENGEQTIRADSGYDALRSVDVTTNVQPDLESKSVTISTNTTTTITPTTGKDGLSSVEITTNVPQPTGTININANGTYNVTNYATAEVQTPSIVPEAVEKDVNFYDYDGKRVYSYTKTEFLALNEYPANPTHDYLTAQGWNWDYQDAVNYVTEYGILDVGQMYITTDGSTKVFIELLKGRTTPTLSLVVDNNGTVEIDWGDNTTPDTITGTGYKINTQHIYSKEGKYIISITPDDNTNFHLSSNNTIAFFNNGANDYLTSLYRSCVKKIYFGKNVVFDNYTFYQLNDDIEATMPLYITDIAKAFADTKVKIIILPKNIQTFSQSALSQSYASTTLYKRMVLNRKAGLGIKYNNCVQGFENGTRVILPDTMTASYNAIRLDYQPYIVIPKTITYLQNFYCYTTKVLDFSHHEAVPTLGSSGFSSDFPSDCQIVVPDSLYEDWIAANNWTNYATQIISKSDFDNQ